LPSGSATSATSSVVAAIAGGIEQAARHADRTLLQAWSRRSRIHGDLCRGRLATDIEVHGVEAQRRMADQKGAVIAGLAASTLPANSQKVLPKISFLLHDSEIRCGMSVRP